MKTDTRNQILKIIEEHGNIRPSHLQNLLKITPQAVHYHLRYLVKQGLVEARGSVPFTQYAPAGIPNLSSVAGWLNASTATENSDSPVCETRDVFSARLPHLKTHVANGLPPNLLPLVVSTAGEIGNNSFDHNFGQWRDVPGCWFESQSTGRQLWVWIADRGQGVLQSLAKVHPGIGDDRAALKAAFETIISGRTPEQRGNGLKFVRESVVTTPGSGIACLSGAGGVHYGESGERCLALLRNPFENVNGTITLVTWRLQ